MSVVGASLNQLDDRDYARVLHRIKQLEDLGDELAVRVRRGEVEDVYELLLAHDADEAAAIACHVNWRLAGWQGSTAEYLRSALMRRAAVRGLEL